MRKQGSRVVGSSMVEKLESRKLMSAVVDVRLPDGGKSVTVNTVGQTISIEVWVTITGKDTLDNEGLQTAIGSLLSSNIAGGAAAGTISGATIIAPFNGSGSQPGEQADLDSDGDLDLGSNNNASAAGFVFARSAAMSTGGTDVAGGESFKIATATFTVTSLLTGVQTNLVYRPRVAANAFLYQEDAASVNPLSANADFRAGTGVVLKREGTATVSGRVFDDKNASGVFDGDDTGIGGFRVFLDEDGDGVVDAGEQNKPVSATGTYTFSNVVAGTYRVREVPRAGWRQSAPAAGFYEIQIGYGQAAKSLSFANTQGVLIKGSVWHDSNSDRVRQSIEAPLSKWRVIVDMNKNGIWDAGDFSKETNAKGEYRFSLLTNGNFQVFARQIEGYRQTTNGGSFHNITLPPGGTTSNKNFGFKRLK